MILFDRFSLQLFWNNWQKSWMVFHLWHRIDDLEPLVKWAKRKRLTGPHHYYRKLLDNENLRLEHVALRVDTVIFVKMGQALNEPFVQSQGQIAGVSWPLPKPNAAICGHRHKEQPWPFCLVVGGEHRTDE
jgi:hypothetical protein